jgi:hypothetical protein
MREAVTGTDIRPLTDAELDEANGGAAFLVIAVACGLMAGVVGGASLHAWATQPTGTLGSGLHK